MKALEFEGSLNPDSTLTVPVQVANLLQPNQPVRVLLLIPDQTDSEAWSRLTAEQCLQGYAESDAIYDNVQSR